MSHVVVSGSSNLKPIYPNPGDIIINPDVGIPIYIVEDNEGDEYQCLTFKRGKIQYHNLAKINVTNGSYKYWSGTIQIRQEGK